MDKEQVSCVDYDSVLFRAQTYCARAERCVQDIKRRMWAWKVPQQVADKVLESLKNDGFIDEKRYAGAFMHDKSSLSGWGMLKIRGALASKGISKDVIDGALAGYDRGDDAEKLSGQLDYKARQLMRSSRFVPLADIDPDDCTFEQRQLLNDFRNRLLRFAVSRGFDYATATELIEKISGRK